jgi:Zn-dependent protease
MEERMTGWWMYDLWQNNPLGLFCAVFWVVFSICLHELAHGYVAIRCGDDTPRLSGHMTLNPFVHIPPMAWILFIISGITWGLMPINPSRFRRTIDEAYVAFAGPAVNLILVALCILLNSSWITTAKPLVSDQTFNNVAIFLHIGAKLNVVLFVFNLLPVPPLDGSRILATFFRGFREIISSPSAATVGLILLVMISRLGGGAALRQFAETLVSNATITLSSLFRLIAH